MHRLADPLFRMASCAGILARARMEGWRLLVCGSSTSTARDSIGIAMPDDRLDDSNPAKYLLTATYAAMEGMTTDLPTLSSTQGGRGQRVSTTLEQLFAGRRSCPPPGSAPRFALPDFARSGRVCAPALPFTPHRAAFACPHFAVGSSPAPFTAARQANLPDGDTCGLPRKVPGVLAWRIETMRDKVAPCRRIPRTRDWLSGSISAPPIRSSRP